MKVYVKELKQSFFTSGYAQPYRTTQTVMGYFMDEDSCWKDSEAERDFYTSREHPTDLFSNGKTIYMNTTIDDGNQYTKMTYSWSPISLLEVNDRGLSAEEFGAEKSYHEKNPNYGTRRYRGYDCEKGRHRWRDNMNGRRYYPTQDEDGFNIIIEENQQGCQDCGIYKTYRNTYDFKEASFEKPKSYHMTYGSKKGKVVPIYDEKMERFLEESNAPTYHRTFLGDVMRGYGAEIKYDGAKRYLRGLSTRFEGANNEGFFPAEEEDFEDIVIDEIGEHTELEAEGVLFYQLEVKYKMDDGWELYGDYDNKQDAINAYYDIYLEYPEVQLLEVDSEGDGDFIYRQRNFDLGAEGINLRKRIEDLIDLREVNFTGFKKDTKREAANRARRIENELKGVLPKSKTYKVDKPKWFKMAQTGIVMGVAGLIGYSGFKGKE